MSDGIVRGWVYPGSWHPRRVEVFTDKRPDDMEPPVSVPVLLLPDDGTQVVVGREEWERMERDHLAMDAMRTNLAPRFAWIFDGFDLKQGSQDVGHNDPADAILGTNGGGE